MSQLTAIQNLDVLILHRHQADNVLPDGFEFFWQGYQLRHKPGGYTDGMSSPQFTHMITTAAPYGWALPAAVAHDGGYHDDLELYTVDGWKPFRITKDECDQMFYDLLLLLAAGDSRKVMAAMAFYEAVRFGGLSAFNQGRERAAIERARADRERASISPSPTATAQQASIEHPETSNQQP
jgi:hypothetical protein